MHQHQASQESELSDGEVRAHDSCATLNTGNTDTNMCLLDHSHVVGSITDRQGHDVEAVLHHADDSSLLRRRDTTTQHGSALLAEQQELLPYALIETQL